MSAKRITCAVLAVLATAAAASATGVFPTDLSKADQERLKRFEAARASAIDEARKGGDTADVAALNKVLDGEATSITPAQMAGDWRCRTLKLGGDLLALVVYSDFKCRITDDAAGLRLEKLTGSQRTAGTFYDLGETRLGYAGAISAGDDPRRNYGDDPEFDQVGYLVPVSLKRMRLELPLPQVESKFDILELRR